MARSAKLTSIDAVQLFASAIKAFEEEASGAMTSLEMATQRILEWIHHERPGYWEHEVRRRRDKLAEARVNLERCTAYRATDERPSCHDEKVALEKAKRRLRIAEEKTEVVRHWARVIDREIYEFRGSLAQLSQWVQADLPQALAALERMAAALESYVAMESSVPSAANVGRASTGSEDAIQRTTDDELTDDEPTDDEPTDGEPTDGDRSQSPVDQGTSDRTEEDRRNTTAE